MRQHTESEARALLRKHALAGEPLTSASGVANDVWLTPSAVIRLNGGRFRDAFRHEALILDLLPASIPHPAVLAHGEREEGGEFLILERLPGRTLDAAWPDLLPESRRHVVRDLAGIVKQLHALPLVPVMQNPWVQDAFTVPIPGDAYHAPPASAPMLVAAAAIARPDLADLIASIGDFIEGRMIAFGLASSGMFWCTPTSTFGTCWWTPQKAASQV
ncbi:MAG: phosphotransferase [Thermomicrobiales bacterium]